MIKFFSVVAALTSISLSAFAASDISLVFGANYCSPDATRISKNLCNNSAYFKKQSITVITYSDMNDYDFNQSVESVTQAVKLGLLNIKVSTTMSNATDLMVTDKFGDTKVEGICQTDLDDHDIIVAPGIHLVELVKALNGKELKTCTFVNRNKTINK